MEENEVGVLQKKPVEIIIRFDDGTEAKPERAFVIALDDDDDDYRVSILKTNPQEAADAMVSLLQLLYEERVL